MNRKAQRMNGRPQTGRLKRLDISKDEIPFVWSRSRAVPFMGRLESRQVTDGYRSKIEGFMEWCNSNNFLIGNVKLYLEGKTSDIWISTTGDEISIESMEKYPNVSAEFQENITAIIFGDGERIQEMLEELFN